MRTRIWLWLSPLMLAGCAGVHGAHPRALHYIDDELVYSPPAPASAYEAYLRARLAYQSDPPRLDEAQMYIERALRMDPRDPHLWTTQALIAWRSGDAPRAAVAAQRALDLRPDYDPAKEVLASMRDASPGRALVTRDDEPSPRPTAGR